MKTLFFAFFSLLFFTACSSNEVKINPFSVEAKKPSSNLATKDDHISFDEIQVSSGIEAEVIKSEKEKVIITAPDNILDDVMVENKNGRLHIHFKPGIRIFGNYNVKAKIFAKDFSAIRATSSGSIVLKDKFVQEKMLVQVSSSGSIEGSLEANEMDIRGSSSGDFSGKIWAINLNVGASSSAEINLKGSAKQSVMRASSSGLINAGDLVSEKATLQASSSGDINLSVSREVSASASSSGDVTVYKKGNVSVTKTENSSGSVTVH